MFREATTIFSKSSSFRENATWMELSTYIWNTEEIRMIQIHGNSMACPSCKGLNYTRAICNIHTKGAEMPLAPSIRITQSHQV